jgi:hypothetical protein
LLAGAAIPTAAYGQCVINAPAVDACLGGVRNAGPAGATLDLNFMFPGSMPPGVTFTRASTATYTDASGVIQTAAVNQPRWESRGLLIEEARTNLLLNSATLGTQSVTVTAQSYTLSFYGTGTVTKSGAATGALVGTGAGQRVSQTFTPTAGTLTLTVAGSVTNAQIEAGAIATSWISTAGASATRAFDRCFIPPASMGFFVAPGGSWLAEFVLLETASATGAGRIIGMHNTSTAAVPMYADTTGHVGQWDGTTAITTANAVIIGAVVKAATTWGANVGRCCLNGGAIASAGLTAGYVLAPTGVGFINDSLGAGEWIQAGYIRRVQYWPRVLSDAELQQVTT